MGENALEVDTLLIGPGVRSGLPILMDNPREVGPDRIVNAVAALARVGGPCIVVDFGTSTNFDAVSAGGEYVGGVLAPGVAISMEALFDRAARLSRVEFVAPPTVIGRNTVHALQSGVVYGFAGQVDGIVRRMAAELGGDPRVLATGGLAGLIVPHAETVHEHVPDLTLEGLRLVYERQSRLALLGECRGELVERLAPAAMEVPGDPGHLGLVSVLPRGGLPSRATVACGSVCARWLPRAAEAPPRCRR